MPTYTSSFSTHTSKNNIISKKELLDLVHMMDISSQIYLPKVKIILHQVYIAAPCPIQKQNTNGHHISKSPLNDCPYHNMQRTHLRVSYLPYSLQGNHAGSISH